MSARVTGSIGIEPEQRPLMDLVSTVIPYAFSPHGSITSIGDEIRQKVPENTDLDRLGERVATFVAEREWARFYSPKNLAMALSVEASELLEFFQRSTEAESDKPDDQRRRRRRAAEEVADVQIYLLQIAARLDVDIGDAVVE